MDLWSVAARHWQQCLLLAGRAEACTAPKAFAVLVYLVAHAGQLVTKEVLFDAVWPGTAVSDTILKACIYQIRQGWGETVDTPQCVATVYGRGYRSELHGATRDRMGRELAEILDTLPADMLRGLILEGLRWSDHAMLDVLAILARRQDPARLCS
jgi:hypothetical protein